MADDKVHDSQMWRQSLAKAIRDRVDAYSQQMLELRKRELKKNNDDTTAALSMAEPAPEMKPRPTDAQGNPHDMAGKLNVGGTIMPKPNHDLCPLCGQEDRPGACKCLQGPLAPAHKNEASGYGNVVTPDMGMNKAEMCKSCGMEHVPGKHVKDADGDFDGDMDKGEPAPAPDMDKVKAHPDLKPFIPATKKGEPTMNGRPVPTGAITAKTEPLTVGTDALKAEKKDGMSQIAGLNPKKPNEGMRKEPCKSCGAPTATIGPKHDVLCQKCSGTKKDELSAKAKEPIKAAAGNSYKKITGLKLAKAGLAMAPKAQALQHGVIAGSKAAAGAPAPAPAAAPKLPSPAANAGRAADLASQLPKPAAAAKPAMPPAPPQATGIAKIKAVGAQPIAPTAAPKLPGMGAKPTPAPGVGGLKSPPVGGAPKLPGLGKSEVRASDLRKNLGSCLLCGKPEHNGSCP